VVTTAHQVDSYVEPVQYEIIVEGQLGARWSAWFEGLEISPGPGATTILHGPIEDQAALHGLLQKLRDLGIPLVSVAPVPPEGSPTEGPAPPAP
jgi:hypothetical protein